MPNDIPASGGHNLGSDPEIRAIVAEAEQSLQVVRAELETKRAQVEAEVAAAKLEIEAKSAIARPQPDPIELAQFEKMEVEYGVPSAAPLRGPAPGGGFGGIIDAAAKLVQEIAKPRASAPAAVERQWYYSSENKRHGPLPQSRLLELLDREELAWTALVWRRAMKEWVAALDTELADLAGPGAPPPLPSSRQPPSS